MKSLHTYILEKLIINKDYKNYNSVDEIINTLNTFKEEWIDAKFYYGVGFEIKSNKKTNDKLFDLIWNNVLSYSKICDIKNAVNYFNNNKIIILRHYETSRPEKITIAIKKPLRSSAWCSITFTNCEETIMVGIWAQDKNVDAGNIKGCCVVNDNSFVATLLDFILKNDTTYNDFLHKDIQSIIDELK